MRAGNGPVRVRDKKSQGRMRCRFTGFLTVACLRLGPHSERSGWQRGTHPETYRASKNLGPAIRRTFRRKVPALASRVNMGFNFFVRHPAGAQNHWVRVARGR